MACRAVARGPGSPPSPRGFGVAAFTRFASEGWWACLDSNQEPDRYERPALTIELQAPPQAVAFATATVPPPLTMWLTIRQCRARNCSRETGVAGRVDRAARVALSRWAMMSCYFTDRPRSRADQHVGLRGCRKFYAMFGRRTVATINASTSSLCGRPKACIDSRIELNATGTRFRTGSALILLRVMLHFCRWESAHASPGNA